MAIAKVTPDEFVKIWQAADSIAEVCEKTGLTRATVSSKASRFRNYGVELKYFRVPRQDWEWLAKLAGAVEAREETV